MLGHLDLIEPELGKRVAAAHGHGRQGRQDHAGGRAARRSRALAGAQPGRQGAEDHQGPHACRPGHRGRATPRQSRTLQKAVAKEGALLKLIAPKIGPMKNGLTPDMTIDGGPSLPVRRRGAAAGPGRDGRCCSGAAGAINWLRDAFAHLKAIGFNNAAQAMFGKGGVDHTAPGVVARGARARMALSPPRKSTKSGTRDELVNHPDEATTMRRDSLATYRAKRDFKQTAEPSGKAAVARRPSSCASSSSGTTRRACTTTSGSSSTACSSRGR